jgi:hypothetical protein
MTDLHLQTSVALYPQPYRPRCYSCPPQEPSIFGPECTLDPSAEENLKIKQVLKLEFIENFKRCVITVKKNSRGYTKNLNTVRANLNMKAREP